MTGERADWTRRAYQRFASTGEPVLDVLHPDAEWHTAADLPDSGVHRGHAAIARLVRGWAESFDDFRAEVEDVVERGDATVVQVTLRGRLRGSGEEVRLPEVHVWRLRGERAIEVREYRTLDEALEAPRRSASRTLTRSC